MTEVGVRQLRDHLSGYLEQVQSGQELVVTDRGRAIARILPISGERALDRLIREGRVVPAKRRERRRPQPLQGAGPVSDLVPEQRR